MAITTSGAALTDLKFFYDSNSGTMSFDNFNIQAIQYTLTTATVEQWQRGEEP